MQSSAKRISPTDNKLSQCYYRPELDGLRALAVLAVIANHINTSILPGGYLGVDIFFVISGYVITLSLQQYPNNSLRGLLFNFYSKRIKRLAPAMIVMVLLVSLAIRFFDPDPKISTISGILALFGLSNIFFYIQAIDYFGNSVKLNPFSHTWSLGVEEQFYLIFPFLFFWQLNKNKYKKIRIAFLAGITVISLMGYIIIYPINQPAAYFLVPFRFWEIGIGCLLAFGLKNGSNTLLNISRKINPSIAFLFIVASLFISDKYTIFGTVFIVFSTASFIASIRPNNIIYKVLTHPIALYIGLISYSLYLWHWGVLSIGSWTIGVHGWLIPLQIFLIFLLSIASYHLIEKPLREFTWFKLPWMTFSVGLTALATCSWIIFFTAKIGLPSFSGIYGINEAIDRSPSPGYIAKYSGREINNCFAEVVFHSATHDYTYNINRCLALTNSSTLLVFVGDSHSMDLLPMADKIYRDGLASVLNIFQPGCRFPPIQGEDIMCAKRNEAIVKYISEIKNQNVILVIRNNYSPKYADGTLQAYTTVFNRFLDQTMLENLNVVYFAPSPKYSGVGPGSFCSIQWFRPVWAITDNCKRGLTEGRGEQLARRQDFLNYLEGIEKTRSKFLTYDPFDLFCGFNDKLCTPIQGGHLIYRDQSHLTEKGSEMLSEPFLQFLIKNNLLR